jgi:hypothetical protein
MDHKLIIFAGACPGAGKSTLSSFLFKQLSLKGINSRWIYEDDVSYLDSFTEVVQAFKTAPDKVLDALLEASHKLVEECTKSDSIYITDAVFPFFDWLLAADFTYESIAGFSEELQPILKELNPLIAYLDCNVSLAVKRAVTQRGAKYEEDFLAYMNTWTYFQQRAVKATNLSDIIEYFEQGNKLKLKLLSDWRGDKLLLFSTASNLRDLIQALLERLALEETVEVGVAASENLQNYAGVYDSVDTTNVPKTLHIKLVDSDLFIDVYWPNGCRLIAQSGSRFILEATNQYLDFKSPQPDLDAGLSYVIGNKQYRYTKRT